MELNYTITEQDYIDFNFHHMNTSTTQQKYIKIVWAFAYLAFAAVIVWFNFKIRVAPLNIKIILNVVSILTIAIVVLVLRRSRDMTKGLKGLMMKNILRNSIHEGKNPAFIGDYHLVIRDGLLTETSPTGKSEMPLQNIEKVTSSATGIYLYYNSMAAFLIPLSAFPSREAVDQFMWALDLEIKKAKGPHGMP